ncbi:MAG: DinB family protein [Phreatobacter sp.]|nr:DinB family protein [Phreatobacter sp.]
MPASNVQTFRAMAYNNAWANQRLLKACAALTPEAFAATRTSFFPSLAATLNHILTIDWFYVDALEGGDLGPRAWEVEIPCPLLADLKREQAAVDRRLVAVCEALTEAALGEDVHVNRISRVQVERRDRLLMHLFQHQVHHRGQAHAMLAGTAVKPPQLDEFFSIGEAALRADEFAELGFSEEAIWGPEGVR